MPRPARRWTPFGPERRLQVAYIVGTNFAGLVSAGTRVYARARVGRRKTPGTLFYVDFARRRRESTHFRDFGATAKGVYGICSWNSSYPRPAGGKESLT